MQKNCFIILILALASSYDAVAQPKFSISKIVGRNSINDADASKIEQYAQGWAEALYTTDALELYEAQRHLIEPLETERVGIAAGPVNLASAFNPKVVGGATTKDPEETDIVTLSRSNSNEPVALAAGTVDPEICT